MSLGKLGGGLVNNLADNVLSPAINHIIGDNRAGEIGANIFKDTVPGMIMPGYQQNPPGYQQPPGEQAPPQGQQDSQQYYQQMRQNIDGMNEAFKQIEQMQMPGGQYQGGGQMTSPGGGKGGKGYTDGY